MNDILDPAEILRRFGVLLQRLASLPYSLAITVEIDTSDPARIDAHDGKPLQQCDLVVGDHDGWDGGIIATVLARDLQLDEDHIYSLSSLLHERAEPCVDLLGQAVVLSHLTDFEKFSTHVAPSAWERGCVNAIHRHYGLTLLPNNGDDVAGLRFDFYASAIAAAVNQRLLQAAEQGAVE